MRSGNTAIEFFFSLYDSRSRVAGLVVVLKVSRQNNRLGKFDVIHKSLADEPRSSDYHRCVDKYDI